MDPILIPILGVFVPIVVVPASLIFKFYKYKRECEHLERMKALEVEPDPAGRRAMVVAFTNDRGDQGRSAIGRLRALLPGLPRRLHQFMRSVGHGGDGWV